MYKSSFIIALFPWVGFGILNTDSQPWPGLFMLLTLFLDFRNVRVLKIDFFIIISILTGLAISIAQSANINLFELSRSIYTYLLPSIALIFYRNFMIKYGFPVRSFIVCNYVWISFSFVEYFLPEVKSYIGAYRTSETRGLTSFAPEPTFFGLYLLFSSWILFLIGYKPKNNYFNVYTINFISVIFLAKSSMVFFYIAIGFVFYQLSLLNNFKNIGRFLYFLVIGAALLFVYPFFSKEFGDSSRLFGLISSVFDNGYLIFYYDQSLNERLEAVVLSYHMAFSNFFIPSGVGTLGEYSEKVRSLYDDFFWYNEGSTRILSWSGDYLYTLGVFSFPLLYFIFSALRYNNIFKSFFMTVFLFILLLSAIPLAFPLIPLLVTVSMHKSLQVYK